MGASLSSSRETVGSSLGGGYNWSQQLRTSKSTFSLKTERSNVAGSSGGGQASGGIFRNGLPSSISFRNLSIGQATFGRRGKEKSLEKSKQHQQQHQLQDQQPKQRQHQLQPAISTISNWSNDSTGGVPDLQHQQQQQKQQLPAAPWKSHSSKSALTKSTSCYTFKASSGPHQQQQQQQQQQQRAEGVGASQDEKENRGEAASTAADSRRQLVQASTSDLLKCVAAYLRQQCPAVNCDAGSVVAWIRSVDRSLIIQGWADMAFVNPPNLVFFYLLVKAAVTPEIGSERQLQATLLTCLYVAYSYMGNEISYPLKPFLVDGNRAAFWDRCLSLASARSSEMLRLNSDPTYFIDVFTELKSYCA